MLAPDTVKELTAEKRDPYGRTILHRLAQETPVKNLELLYACIGLGIDQTVKDVTGRVFVDYLEQWEYDYIKQLCDICRLGKLHNNVYYNIDAVPADWPPNGFLTDGRPIIFKIWEKHLGTALLSTVLEAGVDFDNPAFQAAAPPEQYANILARYGWLPRTGPTMNMLPFTNQYYPPTVWKRLPLEQFKTMPIGTIAEKLFDFAIVCISDTHWIHRNLHIPGGDVLVCAGDVCTPGTYDATDFILWMGSQSHQYKIFVAGNHDRVIENNKAYYTSLFTQCGIIYLEDSGVEIQGIKIWGSPWTSKRPKNKNNAFTLARTDLMRKWNLIPSDTDLLITHCPPFGIGDINGNYFRGASYQSGDPGLRKTVLNRLTKLKLHIFGHQHFGRGIYKLVDRSVYFINCSIPVSGYPYVIGEPCGAPSAAAGQRPATQR